MDCNILSKWSNHKCRSKNAIIRFCSKQITKHNVFLGSILRFSIFKIGYNFYCQHNNWNFFQKNKSRKNGSAGLWMHSFSTFWHFNAIHIWRRKNVTNWSEITNECSHMTPYHEGSNKRIHPKKYTHTYTCTHARTLEHLKHHTSNGDSRIDSTRTERSKFIIIRTNKKV